MIIDSSPIIIHEYNVKIEKVGKSGVRFTDLNTGMLFGAVDIFRRKICVKEILYDSSGQGDINKWEVRITSTNGILYQINLHSFECNIKNISFIDINTIGATYCEYICKPVDEKLGREKLSLNIRKKKAEIQEFRVTGKKCIYEGREKKVWKLNSFQEALLKMFQEMHKVQEYNKMMDISHSGFGGMVREPRLSANKQLRTTMINNYAMYKGETYCANGLNLKKVNYDGYTRRLFPFNVDSKSIIVEKADLEAHYYLWKKTIYRNQKCGVLFEKDKMLMLLGGNQKLLTYGFDFIELGVYQKLIDIEEVKVTVERTDYLTKVTESFEGLYS